MLGKVVNISSQSGYNSSREEESKVARLKSEPGPVKRRINDSSNFSKQGKSLNSTPWKIKNLIVTPGSSIVVEFSMFGYDFIMNIDISDPKNVNLFNYTISIPDIAKYNFVLNFSVYYNKERLLNAKISKKSFTSLKILCDRIVSLKIHSEFSIDESKLLSSLMDELDDGIANELFYMTRLWVNYFIQTGKVKNLGLVFPPLSVKTFSFNSVIFKSL